MLCNTCLNFEESYDCDACYKKPAQDVLHLNTRQWSQIELIGLTEGTDAGSYQEKKLLCKAFADSIVAEI